MMLFLNTQQLPLARAKVAAVPAAYDEASSWGVTKSSRYNNDAQLENGSTNHLDNVIHLSVAVDDGDFFRFVLGYRFICGNPTTTRVQEFVNMKKIRHGIADACHTL